jgi:diguanylate cyclase (GGDEF)-like protein
VVSLAPEDSQQRAELRIAFLRHLPKRLQQVCRRGRRFCEQGWDINGLSVLHDDVQRMAGVAGRYGAVDVSQQLLAVESVLGRFLDQECLPDEAANQTLVGLLDNLAPELPGTAPLITAPMEDQAQKIERAEATPSHYWRRWTGDLDEPLAAADAAFAAPAPTILPLSASISLDSVGTSPGAGAEPLPAPPAPAPTPAPAPAPARVIPIAPAPRRPPAPAAAPRPAAAAVSVARPSASVPRPVAVAPAAVRQASPAARASARIYHLSAAGPVSLELDQRLESMGYELELLDSGEELREVLAALAPDLLVIDAEFEHELEAIGPVLKTTRERSSTRLPLLAIASADSMQAKLAARRAGADALLIAPGSAAEVLAKIQDLLESGGEESYRVLIVEDDRSQGLFAESILRNAGMEARVVSNAFEVLDAMDAFKPDMVLMDLYMPDCDGTELTALIRERDEYLHTPIVFLSGESDLDKHYAALDAGGDDFLSKPIRPKHLIAAVSNRVRRARAMLRRVSSQDPRDSVTGLYARRYALDRITELLGAEDVRSRPGGVLFFDIDGISTLREKLGLTGLEQLLGEVGGLLVRVLEGPDFATRYGDGCFVVVCPERPEGALETLAHDTRARLIAHSFNVGGRTLRLRVAVGVCAFRHGFADAGGLLNVAERCSREARGSERGVRRHEPERRTVDPKAANLTQLIREAIDRDGFELLYQPIVAVQGGEESQFQTLLRLRDENGKLRAAAEVIPLAEKADLMVDVDRWVLGSALRTIEQRRQAGKPLRLFVNQAASSLATAGHGEWIAAQLRARGLPGSELILELTLEDIDAHTRDMVGFCEALIPAGVRFCLSHYEHSAIGESVLEMLPVDFVKLAPKYLMALNLPGTRDDLRLIVENAHRRSLQVIAQRVEDAQSAATLWMSGIDFIQGNLVQQASDDLSFDFQAAVL